MSECAPGPMVGVFRLQLFKRSETFVAAQAGALRRHQPLYIGRRAHGVAPEGVQAVVAAPGLDRWRLTLLADPAPLAKALAGRKVELLHAHFAVDGVYAARLARRLGVPLVVTLHGFDVSRSRLSLLASLRPALVHAVAGWRGLTRQAAVLIAVSEAVAKSARRRGAPAERVRRLPVGVDLTRLRPPADSEPGLVVHVGRLVEKKGTAVLLDAFPEVVRRSPHARLVVIGEGPLGRRLQRRAIRLGVGDRVRWLGALEHAQTLDWLGRAAVVVIPSRVARNGDAEGLPTVLLEAAALGRAVVASDAGGVAEAVRGGQSALLVAPGDADALAAALLRVLGDPDLGRRLGEGARRAAEAGYDLTRQTSQLEDIYEAVRGSWSRGHAA